MTARGIVEGDGHGVTIGETIFAGRQNVFDFYAAAGPGGNAVSQSEGVVHGDGNVRIWDRSFTYGANELGSGGDASSTAIGRNAGLSPVFAQSYAGSGSFIASSGNASASADASGLGEVVALAAAHGGQGLGDTTPGDVSASSRSESALLAHSWSVAASDAHGFASAESISESDPGPIHRARASLDVSASKGRTMRVSTTVRRSGYEGGAVFDPIGVVRRGDRTDPGPTSAIVLEIDRMGAPAHELASLDITLLPQASTVAGASDFTHDALIEMAVSIPFSEDDNAVLDFTGASFTGGGFDMLTLSVLFDGDVLVDRTFTNAATAALYFATTTILLGDLESGGLTGDLVYSIIARSSGANDSFSVGAVLQVVPEPTSGTLLLVGLAWMAVRGGATRRRRRGV